MALAPPFLKTGDKVMLLSTARKVDKGTIENALSLFNEWGLEVEIGESITSSFHQFAGDDLLRARDFQQAIDNPKIKAIFCARGGYGTVRMMDSLNFTKFIQQPKWVVGFSDVTYLHSLINNQLNIQTIHAAMPATYKNTDREAVEAIKNLLFGEEIKYPLEDCKWKKGDEMSGEVIGGNLSILYSITGTKSGFDTTNKILFIEDLDEYLYHMDRMLINLKRSGKLLHLKGLIIGGMSDMHDHDTPFGFSVEDMILEHCKEYEYPIVFNFPAGHIFKNYPIVLGKELSLIKN
jgi:muramoyltetrapeptide carboxypeptidase